MYHGRFKGSHYEAGYRWGELLYKKGKIISKQHTFVITEERKEFAKKCISVYQEYYPEILDEIRGIADGQRTSYEDMYTFLLSMYCFEFNNKCMCLAIADDKNIIFGRNSDFLVELEKLYMNCLYCLDNVYSFNGNTTAFVEMEDGVNEYGLAVGLTFVYPKDIQVGFNSGMLVRYLLEKCKTTSEAVKLVKTLPIASNQTLTIADAEGEIVVIECNSKKVVCIYPEHGHNFVTTANNFNSKEMEKWHHQNVDDWRSKDRYEAARKALENNELSIQLVADVLSGKHGFMCQYNRKEGADTVWSVIYDLKKRKIYRVEGNPGRKRFCEDSRMKFNN